MGCMKKRFGSLWALIKKDLIQEWRSKELLSAMLAFAILTLFIFNYALGISPQTQTALATGVIWVLLVFAGTLGVNRSFVAEQDQGCFDALLLGAPNLGLVYIAKMLSNFLVMVILLAILLPVYSLLYNFSLFNLRFIGLLLLGAWAYSAMATLLAGLSVQTRMRDLLLPVLLFPLIMPVNMAVVKAGAGILEGLAWADYSIWFTLLIVYAVIITTISTMVFEYVIKE